MDDQAVRERVARVEARLAAIEALPDAAARSAAAQAVEGLLELYGEGLARLLACVAQVGGEALVETLAADELVAHLLLLHGLHPVPVETRVRRALEEVRLYLQSHGGNVELLGVQDGVARLRLEGSGNGCPSSVAALEQALEQTLQQAAPDLEGIETEAAAPSRSRPIAFLDRAPPRDPAPAARPAPSGARGGA